MLDVRLGVQHTGIVARQRLSVLQAFLIIDAEQVDIACQTIVVTLHTLNSGRGRQLFQLLLLCIITICVFDCKDGKEIEIDLLSLSLSHFLFLLT